MLVHAGAGGVGLPAIQISKALGARVIATAGSPAKRDVCARLGGADHVVDYNEKDWPKQILKLTGGKGVGASCATVAGVPAKWLVDIVYDPVGLIRGASGRTAASVVLTRVQNR